MVLSTCAALRRACSGFESLTRYPSPFTQNKKNVQRLRKRSSGHKKSFDGCAAACAWSGRWHEMCAHLLTRYTLFQSFKRHNIAIITHVKCHGNYDLKQAK